MPFPLQQPFLAPMTRMAPWYPGQIGVSGSDVERGLRVASRGITMYVDPGHNNATAVGDGTNPEQPLSTLAAAINNLVAWYALGLDVAYSTIVVSGSLDESISITDYTTHPGYCTIVGVGPSIFSPVWEPADDDTPCLVLGAVGWRVTGFRFYAPANTAAVVLPCTQAPYGANAIGIRSVIDNCYLDGSVNGGGTGIDLHGAPYNAQIIDNVFGFLDSGITSTNTGYADAYRAYIAGNWFHESTEGIDASLNVSAVVNNIFNVDGVTAMTSVIDLRAGTRGENLVCGNYFGDADYSQAGGFYANAGNPGGWAGNVSQDTAEAEVGDNGWTIAVPT